MNHLEKLIRARDVERRKQYGERLEAHLRSRPSDLNRQHRTRAGKKMSLLQRAVGEVDSGAVAGLVNMGARYRVTDACRRLVDALFSRETTRGVPTYQLIFYTARALPRLPLESVVRRGLLRLKESPFRSRRAWVVAGLRGLMRQCEPFRGMLTVSVQCVEPDLVKVCVKKNPPSVPELERHFTFLRLFLSVRPSRSHEVVRRALHVLDELIRFRKSVPAYDDIFCNECTPTTEARCNLVQCGPVCAITSVLQLLRLLEPIYARLKPRWKKVVDAAYVCNYTNRRQRKLIVDRLRKKHKVRLDRPEALLRALMKDNHIQTTWKKCVREHVNEMNLYILAEHLLKLQSQTKWIVVNVSLSQVKKLELAALSYMCQRANIQGGILYMRKDVGHEVYRDTGHAVAFTVCEGDIILRNTWKANNSQAQQQNRLLPTYGVFNLLLLKCPE